MKAGEIPETIDLGDGRTCELTVWNGDDLVGFNETHPSAQDTFAHKQGEPCHGGGFLDVPECPDYIVDAQKWTVESWEPLTLSPSILCRICGNHGFVREGKWVSA